MITSMQKYSSDNYINSFDKELCSFNDSDFTCSETSDFSSDEELCTKLELAPDNEWQMVPSLSDRA